MKHILPNTLPSRRLSQGVTVLCCAFLFSCTNHIKNMPEEINVDVPEQWHESEKAVDEPAEQNDGVDTNWLESFDDPELNKYVAIALEKNPDLLSSAAQLKSAVEQVRVTGANLWPSLSISGDKNRIETKTSNITTTTNTVSAALDISWEIDIWGKLSQRKKSAVYGALAETELYRSAELSLVANLSRAWFNLITAKLQLDLAHKRLDSFKRTNALIEENYERGLRSALDVYLSRTDVQIQLSNLSDSEFEYIQFLRTFKTILGEYPDDSLAFKADLPIITGEVSAGLPAQLVERRPDIQAFQLLYKARIEDAKAANRDRFPSLSFQGSIGDSREHLNQLFENNNLVISLVAGVTQPLFRAGALKSQEQQAIYQAESAYANLIKTTLSAFEEVENALSREASLKQQHIAVKKAAEFAQGGLDLALDRYQSGIEDYTTVLESQRRLFDSLRNEINTRNALLQNRINIHLALGGNFSNQDTIQSTVQDTVQDIDLTATNRR